MTCAAGPHPAASASMPVLGIRLFPNISQLTPIGALQRLRTTVPWISRLSARVEQGKQNPAVPAHWIRHCLRHCSEAVVTYSICCYQRLSSHWTNNQRVKRVDKLPEIWKAALPLQCGNWKFSSFLCRKTKYAICDKQFAHWELQFIYE